MAKGKLKFILMTGLIIILVVSAIVGILCFSINNSMYNLKLMTFNIRNLHGDDGSKNSWDNRKDRAVNVINSFSPDIIGMQEAFEIQINYFLSNLNNSYKSIGTSRYGNNSDEYSNIVYRSDKFDVLESGQFWLSDTPDVVASKNKIDPKYPRMCTWAKFQAKDKKKAIFYYFNTHLSTNGDAGKEGVNVILDRIPKYVTDNHIPVFIGGDFNSDNTRAAYEVMRASGFKDTWVQAGKRFIDDTISHQWTGRTNMTNQHIDWIFQRNALKINSIDINHYNENGLYPSDHYPVQLKVDIPLVGNRK